MKQYTYMNVSEVMALADMFDELVADLDGTDALDFPDVCDTIRRIQSLIDDHRGGGEV